ncbi:N-acetyltransferase, partial [Paraburkholderia sp. SIMBA_049]
SWVGYFRYLKSDMREKRLTTEIAVDSRITSLKMLTWNFDGPVVLSDVSVDSGGAVLDSPLLIAKRKDGSQSVNITREPAIRANLLLKRHQCGP